MSDVTVTDMRGYLGAVVEMERRHGRWSDRAYHGPMDLVLQHGRDFQSVSWTTWRGSGFRRMKKRECFGNAFRHAMTRDGLVYVEGYANSGLVFGIHHAWCVTEDGRVVDPTWREDTWKSPVEEWEYVGVPFDFDFVTRTMFSRGDPTYGVLDKLDYRLPLPDDAIAGRWR